MVFGLAVADTAMAGFSEYSRWPTCRRPQTLVVRAILQRRVTVMSEEKLRAELYDSFKNRAMIYYLIFDELRTELGAERAEKLLARAIYRRGAAAGKVKFAKFAPDDLAGLKAAFLGGVADEGRMFQPEVVRDDTQALDIKFHGCPLRDAWLEAGLPDEEVATLCRIAAKIDDGKFQGAGFHFSAETWQPGGEGCCYLHFRPGPR
jgi:hypothetical protein